MQLYGRPIHAPVASDRFKCLEIGNIHNTVLSKGRLFRQQPARGAPARSCERVESDRASLAQRRDMTRLRTSDQNAPILDDLRREMIAVRGNSIVPACHACISAGNGLHGVGTLVERLEKHSGQANSSGWWVPNLALLFRARSKSS